MVVTAKQATAMTLRELVDEVIGEDARIDTEPARHGAGDFRAVVRFPGSRTIHAYAYADSPAEAEAKLRFKLEVELLRYAAILRR